MVVFMRPEGEVLKGTSTVSLQCAQCSNTTEHVVWKQPHGPQVGTVFSRRKTLGMKKYFLVCPTCNAIAQELTKEQAVAMRGT